MFTFLRKSRQTKSRKCFARHQLGIDNRLETRRVPTTAVLAGGVLTVQGTNSAESIELQVVQGDMREPMVMVSNNGQPMGKFAMSAIKRVEVRGMGGDDKITVTGQITAPTILDGGDGNDTIVGGSNGTVILGRAGNDSLFGGDGRDVIIGGTGSDNVVGNGGDDILIGDSTQADDNTSALLGILEQWNMNRSYQERVNALRPDPAIARPTRTPDLTLIDDGAIDLLQGGSGQDWFLSAPSDKITDREKGEELM